MVKLISKLLIYIVLYKFHIYLEFINTINSTLPPKGFKLEDLK